MLRWLALVLCIAGCPAPAHPAGGAAGVGFRVRYADDASRWWLTSPADPDHVYASEYPRAIRVMEWYPAPAAPAMQRRGYVEYAAPDGRPDIAQMNAFLADRDRAAYLRDVATPALLAQLLATPAGAAHDAAALPGRFPLVIYAAGWNSLSPDNTILAESLAAHGFVVVAVPQLPPTVARSELRVDAADIDTQLRDVEIALGTALAWPEVDARHVAVIGYSMGGIVAARLAARHPVITAVVGLDPSFMASEWQAFAFGPGEIDPWDIRVPILALAQPGAKSPEALAYADRYVGFVDGSTHGDFAHEPTFARSVLPAEPARDAAVARHRAIVDTVVAFLGHALGDGRLAGLATPVQLALTPGAKIPTTTEYVAAASRGSAAVAALYADARAKYPGLAIVREPELNAAGYRLLAAGKAPDGVAILELATIAFPGSANAYDSLADGYAAAHDRTRMLATYRKLLEVLPNDASLSPELKQRLAANAQAKLAGS